MKKAKINLSKNRCLLLTLLLISLGGDLVSGQDSPPPAAQDPVKVFPTDPNLLYIGRWNKSNSDNYQGKWIASYLRTKFTGTSVAINLDGNHGLDVSIDGEPFRVVKGGPGLVPLNLAQLDPGDHTLLVGVKGGGGWGFRGLVLDSGSQTKAPEVKPIIEFVGDSITCGTSPNPIEAAGNYSWLTAGALGCDHTQIAWPGRSLMTGFGCDPHDKTGLDKQYFQQNCFYDSPALAWDFSYTPQAIVINLGQNDGGTTPQFRDDYVEFVKNIRAKFPQAHILVMRPFSGNEAEGARQTVAELNSQGDDNVQYVDTTGWLVKSDLSDGVHPSDVGNPKVAAHLVPLLKPLLSPNQSAAQ